MMKRMLGLIAAGALFLALMACSSSPAATAPSGGSNKVLFIGRDGGGDAITVKRLKEVHGMEVTVLADKEVTTEKANGYGLIYVSESVNSGKIKDKFVKSPIPAIYAEPQSTSDTGMTEAEGFGKLDAGNVAKTIQIKDSKHQLAAGLENTVDVYKANGKMGYAAPEKKRLSSQPCRIRTSRRRSSLMRKGLRTRRAMPWRRGRSSSICSKGKKSTRPRTAGSCSTRRSAGRPGKITLAPRRCGES
ncbi:hypothetical protein LJK88_17190 [Paenibacillus sp. P26]|nr:hypothetical protein LJK88_17190 [Paenibacillus sp. P26]